MMKKIVSLVMCFAFLGSTAFAGNINVPAGSSIQAAINSATDGDTITLTGSGVFVGNLRIDKRISLVGQPGHTPKIQNADNTTTSQLILLPGSSGTQIGSLQGGRIGIQYLKWGVGTGATLPPGMIRIDQSTGSLATIENVNITTTGPTTYGMPSGIVQGRYPGTVTIRYSDINLNRTADYTAGGVSANRAYAYGIEIGDMHAADNQSSRLGGPTYTLEHVRIKNYVRAGIWIQYTSSTLNASYTDVGTLGEYASAGGTLFPWGPFVAFYYGSTYTGRIDHCAFQGPGAYHGFGSVGPNGTSVTLSRCVMVSKMAPGQTAYSAFFVTNGSTAASGGTQLSSKCHVTVDHCDIVDLSPSVGTAAGSALLKNSANVNNLDLKITNSNIYSAANRPVNITYAGSDAFTSDYNNVIGPVASTGYTAGANDLSMEPLYFDPYVLDMRYDNNTLRQSDSNGYPIGVYADYSDVAGGIIIVWPPMLNRARNWQYLK